MATPDENLAKVQLILGRSPAPIPIKTQTHMAQPAAFDDDPYRRFPGYYYDSRSKTPTTTHKAKKIGVVHPNGFVDLFTLLYESEGWYEFGQAHYPEQDGKLLIPVDRCAFTYAEPKFNPCVYTASNDYIQARWGRKLDDSDRRWLARHALSTDAGVPQEYTATCIDQLTTPYGMRVSRMRLRKGSLVLGDSLTAWMQALGVNPFAMADRQTSNADAAARLGMTIEQADALWRVEFHDDALPCSIVGERGWTSGNGVSTGAGGGHARYLAPRSRAGDWFISLQLDTDDRVSYLVPPPNPEYIERLGDPTLVVASILQPQTAQVVAVKTAGKWHREGETPPAVVTSTVIVPTTSAPSSANDFPDPAVDTVGFDLKVRTHLSGDRFCCSYCVTPTTVNESYAGLDICMRCAEDAFYLLVCPHCKADMHRNPPMPIAMRDEYEYECVDCHETVTVDIDATSRDERSLSAFSSQVFLELMERDDWVNDPAHADMGPLVDGLHFYD